MKRIFLVACLFLSLNAMAQTISVSKAEETVNKSLAETQDAKKAVKAVTWIKLGQSYANLYDAEIGLGLSMLYNPDPAIVKLTLSNDAVLTEENVELAGKAYVKRNHANHSYYYDEAGILKICQITKSVCPDALELSVDAYAKAAELDVKGSKSKDINGALTNLNTKFRVEAEMAYNMADYARSSKMFVQAVKAMATAPLCQIDTLSTYNTAFTAMLAQDYAVAKEYYLKSLNLGYLADGMVHYKLSEIASIEGDKDTQLKYLEEGFQKFPQSEYVLFGLINFYNTNNMDSSRLFELLNQVKALDPNNYSIYSVEGGVYEKLGQIENAEKSYRQCIELAPQRVEGYYLLAALFYNQASEISGKMTTVTDSDELTAMSNQIKELLKKVVDPFEKVVELAPADSGEMQNALQGLKSACFQLRFEDPSYKDKYDVYKKKYDELTGK